MLQQTPSFKQWPRCIMNVVYRQWLLFHEAYKYKKSCVKPKDICVLIQIMIPNYFDYMQINIDVKSCVLCVIKSCFTSLRLKHQTIAS